mgnify:CR=1 FL=1
MRVLRDRELEQLALEVLERDSRVDPREVSVRVENGTAYVTGSVDSAAERRAVQEDLEAIAEVVRVVDMLTLRNYRDRPGEEIAASVKNSLIRDTTVDAGLISVTAEDGVVSLHGRVSSYAQKRAAEDVAWWTPGVTDVASFLQVEESAESLSEWDR